MKNSFLPALLLALAIAAATACSDGGGTADGGARADSGNPDSGAVEEDAGGDAGDGGVPCPPDAGSCPPGFHCDPVTGGCAQGCIADSDCPKYYQCAKTSGKCEEMTAAATITVDTAGQPKTLGAMMNASGIEVEGNGSGIGSEMLLDRGFEWDRTYLEPAGLDPWKFYTTSESMKASVEWSTAQVYQGARSFKISVTQESLFSFAVLEQAGLGIQKGRDYTFSFSSYDEGSPPDFARVELVEMPSGKTLAGPVDIDMRFASGKWTYRTANLAAVESSKNGALRVKFGKISVFWLDMLGLRPKLAVKGFWTDLADAFKAAGVSGIRLGGTSADGYDWRDGVGLRDKRPVRKQSRVATSQDLDGVLKYYPYYNDFGTDEFLDFCAAVGAEPLITVNFPLGAQAAANWVEYANGVSPGIDEGYTRGWKLDSYKSTDNAPAQYFAWLREVFGHKDPFGVKYWEIGNEIWNEELPEPGSQYGQPNLDNYSAKALAFTGAMKAVDGTILVGANSAPFPTQLSPDYRVKWNATVLDKAGPAIDFLAPHFMAPGDFDPAGMSAETLWYKMAGTGPYYSTELTKLQGAIDAWKSRSGSARNIRIAATAFNIVNGTYYYRDAQGSARMRSVAGLASLKNIAIRAQPWMAFHYSLAGGPAGLVGWDAEAMAAGAPLETGGYLVHKLYSDLARPQSFPVTVTAPSYTTWYGGWDPVSGAILDAAATSDSSLNSMTIFVANRKFSAEPVLTMIKTGAFVGGTAKAHVVAGKGPDVYNIVAKPGEISLSVEDLGKVGKEFKYAFRPYSVTAVELVK